MREVWVAFYSSGATVLDIAEHIDFVEELRLRRTAREQYVPPSQRAGLHPIVLDELSRMDAEGLSPVIHPNDDTVLTDEPDAPSSLFGSPIVPLMPDVPGWHGPHDIVGPHEDASIPADSHEPHYT